MNQPEQKEWVKQLSLLVIVSTVISSYSLGGVAIGYFLYTHYSFPILVPVLLGMTGLGFGIDRVMRVVKRMNQSK